MDDLLQIDTCGPKAPNHDVGADACSDRDISVGVGDRHVGRIVAIGLLGLGLGVGEELLDFGGGDGDGFGGGREAMV